MEFRTDCRLCRASALQRPLAEVCHLGRQLTPVNKVHAASAGQDRIWTAARKTRRETRETRSETGRKTRRLRALARRGHFRLVIAWQVASHGLVGARTACRHYSTHVFSRRRSGTWSTWSTWSTGSSCSSCSTCSTCRRARRVACAPLSSPARSTYTTYALFTVVFAGSIHW